MVYIELTLVENLSPIFRVWIKRLKHLSGYNEVKSILPRF